MNKMKEKEQGSSPTLPSEIMEEIFLRQSIKTLMRFRCVSKQWRSLFTDPDFIVKYMNRSAQKNPNQNPTHILVEDRGGLYTSEIDSGTQERKVELILRKSTPVRIEALCDGLVCLSYGASSIQEVHLYNPATRECLLLPEDYCDCHYLCFGLGFDPITQKYKVVKVTYMDDKRTSVKIYTLGSHRWRRIGHSIPLSIKDRCPNASASVGRSGHWVVIPNIRSILWPVHTIPSFDFQQEVFQEVPLPDFSLGKQIFQHCVGVIGGCLSVYNDLSMDSFEIWVMKEYGVRESWNKLFTMNPVDIHYYRPVLPLVFWKDGEILLQKDGSELILYNPETKTKRKLGFSGLPSFFDCSSFVESPVPLKVGSGGTTKSKKEVKL